MLPHTYQVWLPSALTELDSSCESYSQFFAGWKAKHWTVSWRCLLRQRNFVFNPPPYSSLSWSGRFVSHDYSFQNGQENHACICTNTKLFDFSSTQTARPVFPFDSVTPKQFERGNAKNPAWFKRNSKNFSRREKICPKKTCTRRRTQQEQNDLELSGQHCRGSATGMPPTTTMMREHQGDYSIQIMSNVQPYINLCI